MEKQITTEIRDELVGHVKSVRDDSVAIGISGSVSKNLYNRYSDTDLFVIVKNTYFNRFFSFFNNRPLEMAFVNTDYLDNLVNCQMPPYRIYFEAGNLQNLLPLEDKQKLFPYYTKRLLALVEKPEIREKVIPDYFSTLLNKIGGVANGLEQNNDYKVLYSSRILAEYSGLMLTVYNGVLHRGQSKFLEQVGGLEHKPDNFLNDFVVAGNYTNTSSMTDISRSSLRLVNDISKFLTINPLNLPYSDQLKSFLRNSKLFLREVSAVVNTELDKKLLRQSPNGS